MNEERATPDTPAGIAALVVATGGVELAASALQVPEGLVEAWMAGRSTPSGPQRDALLAMSADTGLPANAVDDTLPAETADELVAETSRRKPPRLGAATPSRTRVLTRQIANRLMSESEIPTAERVRKLITVETGGRSNPSTNTVQTEMQAWRDEEFWPTWGMLKNPIPDLRLTPGQTAKFVADLQAVFAATFRTLAVEISQASDARYLTAKQTLESDVKRLEGLLATTAAARDAATTKLAVVEKSAEKISHDHDVACADLRAEKGARAAAVQDATEARQTAAEAEVRHAAEFDHAKELHQQTVHGLQVEMDAARQTARRDAERAHAEGTRANAESGRAAAVQLRADALGDELGGVRVELATRSTQLEALHAELAQATAATTQAGARADALAADLSTVRADLTRLETLHAGATTTLASRVDEITQLRVRLEVLFGERSVALAEVDRLTAASVAAARPKATKS